MLPTGSPIDIRMILPVVFRLKTMIGRLLSRHIATSRRVHDAERPATALPDRRSRVLNGVRELQRILVVNAIHPRGLGDHLGLDFERAQRGRRIRGEVRIGGARRRRSRSGLFPDGGWRDAGYTARPPDSSDGAHHARRHPHVLQGVLQGERIDHRGQHAHLVCRSHGPWLRAAAATPRKMLPPPTTTPTCTPAPATSATSRRQLLARAPHQCRTSRRRPSPRR